MERTLRWARRGRAPVPGARGRPRPPASPCPRPGRPSSASFRAAPSRTCATAAWPARVAVGFEGYAIGGLSVGEPTATMYDIVAHTAAQLPESAAPLPDGHRDARRPRRERGARASTCSTACCRRATRATGSSSPGTGPISIKNARYAEDLASARSGVHVSDVPASFTRLSASPFHDRRDERRRPQHVA